MTGQSVDKGNPARVLTCGQVLVVIAGLVLFPGNKSSSFLNAKVLSS